MVEKLHAGMYDNLSAVVRLPRTVLHRHFRFACRACVALTALLFVLPSAVHAQLPFFTDDADTTGKGKFHFEFFDEQDVLPRALYPAKRQNTANFKLNYGLTKSIELDADVPLLTIYNSKASLSGNATGIGDTEFGVKYNFHREQERSRMPALTAAFYVEAPTGSTAKQLGAGVTDYFLYGVAQKSLTRRMKLRTNAGILFAGNTATGLVGIRTTKGKVFTGNAPLVRDFTPKLKLGAEMFGGFTSNFELSKGQLETQFGGSYALRENLALVFGVVGGRFVASPRVGALLGFAYDFK